MFSGPDREPAEPVRPGREAVDVLGDAWPAILVRRDTRTTVTPPVRSGIIAESSARNRQSNQPDSVMTMMLGIDAAPMLVTITGAIPVTRIVPARPITNAPHQFVSCGSPPPA